MILISSRNMKLVLPIGVQFQSVSAPGAVFHSDTQNETPRRFTLVSEWNTAPGADTLWNCTPIGTEKYEFFMLGKYDFNIFKKYETGPPYRGAIPECVGTWRGVPFWHTKRNTAQISPCIRIKHRARCRHTLELHPYRDWKIWIDHAREIWF